MDYNSDGHKALTHPLPPPLSFSFSASLTLSVRTLLLIAVPCCLSLHSLWILNRSGQKGHVGVCVCVSACVNTVCRQPPGCNYPRANKGYHTGCIWWPPGPLLKPLRIHLSFLIENTAHLFLLSSLFLMLRMFCIAKILNIKSTFLFSPPYFNSQVHPWPSPLWLVATFMNLPGD